MSEDPVRNACLNPRSLVMTRCECFYCFGPEGERCAQIDYNFGIKSCDFHYTSAVRDCNAYLHRERFVPLHKAVKHPLLKPFFDLLPKQFPVLRSSGAVDLDWSVNGGVFPYSLNISFNKGWSLPVKNKDGEICKYILLTDFLKPEILDLMPAGFDTVVSRAIANLEAGLYAEEQAVYQRYLNDSSLADVPDIPEIKTVMLNGTQVRVLL